MICLVTSSGTSLGRGGAAPSIVWLPDPVSASCGRSNAALFAGPASSSLVIDLSLSVTISNQFILCFTSANSLTLTLHLLILSPHVVLTHLTAPHLHLSQDSGVGSTTLLQKRKHLWIFEWVALVEEDLSPHEPLATRGLDVHYVRAGEVGVVNSPAHSESGWCESILLLGDVCSWVNKTLLLTAQSTSVSKPRNRGG